MALTDDDAEPRNDWIERIKHHFEQPEVGGVGGRDDQVVNPGRADRVGELQWFGRLVGNHHLGVGDARPSTFSKGSIAVSAASRCVGSAWIVGCGAAATLTTGS